MGLLDELEQEAERRRSEEAKAEADRDARDALWRGNLRPRMGELSAYLKKLTDNLAFLKRRTRVTYALPGYGDVVAYVDPQYVFRDEPGKIQHEITIECVAQVATEECPVVDADNAGRVRALNNAFQTHRLAGMGETRKDANGNVVGARFQARGKIPLKLVVFADRDGGIAKMSFTNFEALGSSGRSFAPDLLTDELFDSLGRFLAREELAFAQESVGEDIRRQLQNKIQRDQLKREWEQKLSRHLGDDEAKVLSYMGTGAEPGSVFGRLRLAARKIIGK